MNKSEIKYIMLNMPITSLRIKLPTTQLYCAINHAIALISIRLSELNIISTLS